MPTMHGILNSLATTALWDVIPPWAVTMAPALIINGTMFGWVLWVTRISPLLKSFIAFWISSILLERTSLTLPETEPWDAGVPLSSVASIFFLNTVALRNSR